MSQHPDTHASASTPPLYPLCDKNPLHKPHGRPRRRRQPISPSGKQYRALSTAMEGRFIGPMPTSRFLETFMPVRSKRPDVKFSDFSIATPEPFARVLSAFQALTPSLHVYKSEGIIDQATGLSATMSLYSQPMIEDTSDFAEMELFVKAWPDEEDDPFSDQGEGLHYPFELDSELQQTMRGQIVGCAAAVSALQYRTHLFSLVAFGDQARFMRWDPSGVVVSQRFPCVGNNILAEFLWRFDGMTPSARGHDPTVIRVEESWPTHLAPMDTLRQLAAGDNNGHNPKRIHRRFCVMKIPDSADPTHEIDVVISSPPDYNVNHDLPYGRSTRPLNAYDIGKARIVFVKQYWRLLTGNCDAMKEGDVYRRLAGKKVRNLPDFGAGNDVRNLASISQEIQSNPSEEWECWESKQLDKYHLYRISLHTIGLPLSQFQSPKELLRVVRDAMLCHDDAFFNADVLHRDISPGNIMIDESTRKGILVDWELAFDVSQTPFPETRMGTWEFMSSGLLRRDKAVHTVADDRESAIYVLVWMILEHLRPKLNDKRSFDSELFTERTFVCEGHPFRGGTRKLSFLLYAAFHKDVTLKHDQHLADLVSSLQEAFAMRYSIYYPEKDIAAYEKHQELIAPLSQQTWFVDRLDQALRDNVWSSDLLDPPPLSKSPKRKSTEAALQESTRIHKSQKISLDQKRRRSL